MKIDWAAVFADAWHRWKRDRQLLLPLAGLFLFLPQFAFYLLATRVPTLPPGAADDPARLLAPGSPLIAWMETNAPGMLASVLAMAFGALAVLTLYLGEGGQTLGRALSTALRLFPRYLLAMIVVGLPAAPVQLGLLLLVIPCLYLLGRLMLVGPALVAERPIGVGRAIGRSFALTKGRGLVMMGLAAMALFAGMLAPAPFRLLRDSLQGVDGSNPVAVALIEAAGSGLAAAVTLATALVEISLYRRLSAASRGI
ncbi:MAG: hypothetical protein ACTHMG_07535 [Sphingomonas sp.]